MSKDAARLVLVVEDDVSVRRPLVKFLEMHGFAVVTAETSDEGLEQIRKNRLVAAVVDLRLRPRTRLIEKPYSLVLLVETLEEMLAESGSGGAGSQNLHP